MDAFVTRTPGSRKRRLFSQTSTPLNSISSQNDTQVSSQNENIVEESMPFLDGISRTEYVDKVSNFSTEDELSNILSLLELGDDINNIVPGVQQIIFDEDMTNERYRLMEVDSSLLDYFTDPNTELVFRGNFKDDLTLCTNEKTFKVMENYTSKTYLLFPEFKFSDFFNEINCKTIHKTISQGVLESILVLEEQKICNTKAVEEYFKNSQLKSFSSNNDISLQQKIITIHDLLNDIQLSEKELISCFDKLPIINENGMYYWISDEYQKEFFDTFINTLDGSMYEGFGIESLNFTLLRKIFPEHVKDGVIEWFLKCFCKVDEKDSSNYVLMKDKFILNCVKYIIKKLNIIKVVEFTKIVNESLPFGLEFDIKKHLKGLGVIHTSITGDTIQYIDINMLSNDVRNRLKQLFSYIKQWECGDIYPFLLDICGDVKGCDEALIKYCRSIRNGNSRIYVGMKYGY
ncbi:Sister chromatid cohesion protein DCC1 [Strongyloides ratti]|uniref:Sister chromatid cohesion protein DCC1 n=1 Tax=Strongyloides ratti TaxID=34506 RepID=A0A090L1A5_STRRB|nr:Sister chromatid cohesion protein DCC1 [Strongyloides ratti]CEF61224.1 Sister chromatid cohesion protein DCC1 [Strongyloides ratti]